jgi:putative oxidoreductase
MTTLFGVLALIGRLMLVAIFVLSAVGQKIPKFSETAAYMGLEGVPMPKVMLVGAIAFLIVGGLSVGIGFKARIGATLLLVFLLLATYFFHDFWTQIDPMLKQEQMIQFMKNASMMGAMLIIIAHGPGLMSIDGRMTAARRSA